VLVDISRRAEDLGFSSLATIGRMAFPSYEELVALSAAAGATERIGLMTDILLAPIREPVLLARQAATLDQLSRGRLKVVMGRVKAAWQAAGREGEPEFRALAYFAIGDEVHAEGQSNIAEYYGDWGGPGSGRAR
jgi:alkanesulfonate monooxygenase SsuD/methylene tetrahydromethanopterin reductase-like flavin-dependent oxidoreductase (luciferase family)